MTEGFGAIVLRAVLCGLVVWIVVRSVDRAPDTVTAAIISLPMGIAAGYAAMAAHAPQAFLVDAIERGLQMFVGIIAFVAVAGRYFDRLSMVPLVTSSCLAWFAAVVPALVLPTPMPIYASLLLGVVGMILSHVVFPFEIRFPAAGPRQTKRRPAWPVAVQAIILVLVLSVFAQFLGPGLSAALAAIPAVLIFVTIAMKKNHNTNAGLTYQSARLGISCLYAYLVMIVAFLPYYDALQAVAIALIPTFAFSACIVAVRVLIGRQKAPV